MFNLSTLENSSNEPHEQLIRLAGLSGVFGFWNTAPERFVEECNKMMNGTNAIPYSEHNNLIWVEDITNNFGTDFTIKIIVPPDFPFRGPRVFVLEPELSPTECKHMYPSGALCLLHPDDYNTNMSILEFRNLAAAWVTLIEEYAKTGEWGGAEYPHEDEEETLT